MRRALVLAAGGVTGARAPLLPPGLFSSEPGAGIQDDVRQLSRRPLIPATDLDSGERWSVRRNVWRSRLNRG